MTYLYLPVEINDDNIQIAIIVITSNLTLEVISFNIMMLYISYAFLNVIVRGPNCV